MSTIPCKTKEAENVCDAFYTVCNEHVAHVCVCLCVCVCEYVCVCMCVCICVYYRASHNQGKRIYLHNEENV